MSYLQGDQDSADYSLYAGSLPELHATIIDFLQGKGEHEYIESLRTNCETERMLGGGYVVLRTSHRWSASITVSAA